MEDLEEYLRFAKDIAYYAGDIMKKYFNTDNHQTYKGDRTIVTIADKEINSYLIQKVKEKYPEHAVDGEEEQYSSASHVWVCDPVDGTAVFARHIPVAVFSLALVVDGKPIIGVVYDPFTDNLYSAAIGKGAYKNDKKIHVNDYTLSDVRSYNHYDMFPLSEFNMYDILQEFKTKTTFISVGTIIRAAMCVADGEFTSAVFPGKQHKNCDVAAVKVIVEEAGGIVTDFYGNDQRYDRDINGAVITNGVVHDEILEAIKKHI